jgi:hypothetical protein
LRPEDEEEIAKAIAAYEKLWSLVNELTSCEVTELRRRARERQRARRRRRS